MRVTHLGSGLETTEFLFLDELLTKQAPHSLEAEQAVLGSMLIDSRCVSEVIGILKPEDFYLRQNKEIFETIYSMFNYAEAIDAVTVFPMRNMGPDAMIFVF